MGEHPKNPHAGHRQRLRERYHKSGLDGFAEHEVLELLLFYGIPYQDTNPIAHRLLDRFGSLAGVLDAPVEELVKVSGIGENTAFLLKLLPDVYRRYLRSSQTQRRFSGPQDAIPYLSSLFVGQQHEYVGLLLLDSRGRLLFCDVIDEGTAITANIYIKRIVQKAVQYDAVYAYLAHNHPSGDLLPSRQDMEATQEVAAALKSVEVQLVDHIIFAGRDYLSMHQSGLLEQIQALSSQWDAGPAPLRRVSDPNLDD